MQNCNTKNFTLLVQNPKTKEKVTELRQEAYRYKLLNGQNFVTLPKIIEEKVFRRFLIDFGVTSLQVPCSPDYLTFCESDDVEASLAEIKVGRAKKFESVDAFLKELKE